MATKSVTIGDKLSAADGKYRGDRYKVEAAARSVSAIDDGDTPYDLGTDESVVLADATSGVITVNLPPAADAAGMVLTVKKTGTGVNAITLDGNGAELVDGGATYTALDAANDSATFVCDGTEWHLINSTLA